MNVILRDGQTGQQIYRGHLAYRHRKPPLFPYRVASKSLQVHEARTRQNDADDALVERRKSVWVRIMVASGETEDGRVARDRAPGPPESWQPKRRHRAPFVKSVSCVAPAGSTTAHTRTHAHADANTQ
ncbi:hypothetical protein QTP88_005337 [Uroleucon formosanum]